jgi:hypothetical protein
MAQLFGVFANHSPESCPLNNATSRDTFLKIGDKLKASSDKFHVKRIVGFYMSVLEHLWVIVVEAENAHDIENMCIEAGISAMSTIKIVPMNDYEVVMKRIKGS